MATENDLNIEQRRSDRAIQKEYRPDTHVVQKNRQNTVRMLISVLILNIVREVQGNIEDSIARMAEDIQSEKIKIQASDTSSFEIEINLRIEGNRPSSEVDPANDLDENS